MAVGKGKERTFGGRIMDITDEALALEHEMNAMIDPGMDVCLTCGQGERYDEEADNTTGQ